VRHPLIFEIMSEFERILRPCSLHNRLDVVFLCIKKKIETLRIGACI